MKTTETIEFKQDPTHFFRIESIEEFDDGSGFSAVLTLQSGPFGCAGHLFYFERLAHFHKELVRLYENLKGRAAIGPTYEHESIIFEAQSLGHIEIKGELQHCQAPGSQSLRFCMTTDQSYLQSLIQSVERVLTSLKKDRPTTAWSRIFNPRGAG